MTRRVRRLPVVPAAEPVQLVLSLPLGIERPRRRRRPRSPHPWCEARKRVAA